MSIDDLVLENICPECNGAKGYNDIEADGGWADCGECNGAGFVPTSIGSRILDLIRHNSRVTISAALEVSSSRYALCPLRQVYYCPSKETPETDAMERVLMADDSSTPAQTFEMCMDFARSLERRLRAAIDAARKTS